MKRFFHLVFVAFAAVCMVAGWLIGVGSEGLFECPEGLEVKYTDSCIPTGWSVNGAAPGSCQEFSYPEFIVN